MGDKITGEGHANPTDAAHRSHHYKQPHHYPHLDIDRSADANPEGVGGLHTAEEISHDKLRSAEKARLARLQLPAGQLRDLQDLQNGSPASRGLEQAAASEFALPAGVMHMPMPPSQHLAMLLRSQGGVVATIGTAGRRVTTGSHPESTPMSEYTDPRELVSRG
eukprot:CAMPEP_0180274526 /NCGR_PEP_ID=MMETSP0988-20121125/5370_1 /TAXON_ID=697907 /ORGANISM="non described non described, Strain CCMP2293" /LENGTH=163 /DNA_ID=CAMNT_0022245759 /DNA_START=105 /DNA_END=592 /DNA_ORIENTATION=+